MLSQQDYLEEEVKSARDTLRKAVLGDNPFQIILNSVVQMQADVFKSKQDIRAVISK